MDVVYLATYRSSAQPPGCPHESFAIGDISATVCPQDSSVTWSEEGEDLDPMQALARLFGSFDLAGRLDALGAPGAQVLTYIPGSAKGRARLRGLPAGRWLEVAPGLWAMTDGAALLLSPSDPVMADNLGG